MRSASSKSFSIVSAMLDNACVTSMAGPTLQRPTGDTTSSYLNHTYASEDYRGISKSEQLTFQCLAYNPKGTNYTHYAQLHDTNLISQYFITICLKIRLKWSLRTHREVDSTRLSSRFSWQNSVSDLSDDFADDVLSVTVVACTSIRTHFPDESTI